MKPRRSHSQVSRSHRARGFRHPGRVIAGAFAAAVAVGTGLLSLPIATAGPGRADFLTALFHATSAVCVTGLVTVDTGTYWSGFGQAVILLCIQVGGLGIMTLATLLALLLSRRLGLRARLIAQAETKALSASDVRRVVRRVVMFSLATEAVIATVLAVRFAARLRRFAAGRALRRGVPRHLGLQQRGVRLVHRQPHRLRRPTRGSA